MKRTNEAIERDLAALIKHGNDLRRDSAELSRAAKELLKKAARLKGVLARSADRGRISQSPESDQPFYTPNRGPAPQRHPRPGERLFESLRGHDRFLCELRDDRPHGVEGPVLSECRQRLSTENGGHRGTTALPSHSARALKSDAARSRLDGALHPLRQPGHGTSREDASAHVRRRGRLGSV